MERLRRYLFPFRSSMLPLLILSRSKKRSRAVFLKSSNASMEKDGRFTFVGLGRSILGSVVYGACFLPIANRRILLRRMISFSICLSDGGRFSGLIGRDTHRPPRRYLISLTS